MECFNKFSPCYLTFAFGVRSSRIYAKRARCPACVYILVSCKYDLGTGSAPTECANARFEQRPGKWLTLSSTPAWYDAAAKWETRLEVERLDLPLWLDSILDSERVCHAIRVHTLAMVAGANDWAKLKLSAAQVPRPFYYARQRPNN